MFLKKNFAFLLVISIFTVIFCGSNFAAETTQGLAVSDTSEAGVNIDEKASVIPANYQAAELVKEIGIKKFTQAGQIVISPDNKVIYVADLGIAKILAFDPEGELLFSFGGMKGAFRAAFNMNEEEAEVARKKYEEETVDKFRNIMNIAIDAKGNIYGADYTANCVKVFTPDGKYIFTIPMQEKLQKRTSGKGASGVAVNSRGNIYISDSANGRVQINDLNGRYKYQITRFKNREGKELSLLGPAHPRINSMDQLYVLDSLVCKISRFNAKGNYLGSFGYMGDGAGGFNAPNGLAIDKLDRVYVIDRGFGVVQVFTKDGNFLFALCDEEGEKLDIPLVNGITVSDDNLIYISMDDEKGSHVKVFKYLTKTSK